MMKDDLERIADALEETNVLLESIRNILIEKVRK